MFVYGSLRQEEVQRELFGRVVPTEPAVLRGWRLSSVTISDPEVVRLSGSAVHKILEPSQAKDEVPGYVLHVTDAELEAADRYEVDAYRRIELVLADLRSAFAYVAA